MARVVETRRGEDFTDDVSVGLHVVLNVMLTEASNVVLSVVLMRGSQTYVWGCREVLNGRWWVPDTYERHEDANRYSRERRRGRYLAR